MPRKSKKKLEELTQTDGKQETFQPTTLEQIFGDKGLTKYGTSSVEDYNKQLKEMNLSDLRRHSLKIGIVPAMSRERIEKQLVIKFKQYTNLYQKPFVPIRTISPEKLEAARKIMSAVK